MKSNKGLSIINIVLLLAALAVAIWGLIGFECPPGFKWALLISIFALVCGFAYSCMGFSKSAAAFYMLFMALLAIACVINAVAISKSGTNSLGMIMQIIVFVVVIALAVRDNTGKKASTIMMILMVAAQVVLLISTLAMGSSFGAQQLFTIDSLLLVLTAASMVIAKYRDKTARGTN